MKTNAKLRMIRGSVQPPKAEVNFRKFLAIVAPQHKGQFKAIQTNSNLKKIIFNFDHPIRNSSCTQSVRALD